MSLGLESSKRIAPQSDTAALRRRIVVRGAPSEPSVAKVVSLDARRRTSPKRQYWRKRLFDFIVASVASLILAPALALIWIAVRLTSRGPGLFWSLRAGRNGRTFSMPKFRTMGQSAPQQPREQLKNADQHVTWLGKILRRWSIDELPQLYCILKGDMSFIGPRPLMPSDPAQIVRGQFPDSLSVRPGLSGLAQVRGRNHVTPRRKARLDAFYARARTGPFDLEIFARTIGVLVNGRGFM